MLRVTKRKLSIFAGALAAALGLTLTMTGVAHAWPNKNVTTEADCDGVTLTGHGFEDNGRTAQSIAWEIDTEPVTTGSLTPAAPTTTVALPPGHYVVTWTLIISPGNEEPGTPKEFDVPECPGSAEPVVDVEENCAEGGISVFLDNFEGTADAVFTISVDGDALEPDTVPAGEGLEVVVELDDGTYSVVVTEETTEFESEPFEVTVDCVEGATPTPTPTPTPTDTDQGSVLPKTGAGFPTGAAAAFALFLLAVGGFLMTYRKGMLPMLAKRRH